MAVLVAGGGLDQPFLDLLGAGLIGDDGLALAGLDDPGEHLAEQFGGGAPFERNVVRRIMVAGEQAPQLAVAQDRDRHRGADAHVLQIFDMDRRHRPQRAHRQVEQAGAVGGGRKQRRRFGVDVGDDAQPVAGIERARLETGRSGGSPRWCTDPARQAARPAVRGRRLLLLSISLGALRLGGGDGCERQHAASELRFPASGILLLGTCAAVRPQRNSDGNARGNPTFRSARLLYLNTVNRPHAYFAWGCFRYFVFGHPTDPHPQRR